MAEQRFPLDALVGSCRQFQFSMADLVRRLQGNAYGAFGLDAVESPYRIIASGLFWRLRDYGQQVNGQPLLIVAAPIKRPYIWDLTASTSAIRNLLAEGFRIQLLEWLPASHATSMNGLNEYTRAVSEAVTRISKESRGVKPFLLGHSLGGTLAALFAASKPDFIRGLVLLSAPLCFQAETSRFRDALVSLVPSGAIDHVPFPGSLLSHMSALASPETFIWARLADVVSSLGDNNALETHARIERWALDEVALPGKLVSELIDWLYREDRFYRSGLTIDGVQIGPSTLSTPTLAVVNEADEVAPPQSVRAFIDAMPRGNGRIIEFPGENGVSLQHLAIMVGRKAREQVWPEIISWIDDVAARKSP